MSRALATGIGIFHHPGPAPLVMRGKRNARREPARGVAVWGGSRRPSGEEAETLVGWQRKKERRWAAERIGVRKK